MAEIQSDKGTEFTNNALSSLLKAKGIRQRLTNAAIPIENELIERQNGRLQTIMEAPLKDVGFLFAFWAKAVKVANYLINRSYRNAIKTTPYYKLYGRKANLAHLRVLGAKCKANVPKRFRRKGQPHAQKAMMLGYEPGQKSYRLYCPD